MRLTRVIVICLAASLVLLLHAAAMAHWDMEPRFWADATGEKFFLRIHNGAYANRSAVRKELNVCFWVEERSGNLYQAVSEKKCSMVTLKPDEWMDFVFDLRTVTMRGEAINGVRLKKGSYRAVAVAREQRGMVARILLGAALERLYSYFQVQ
ncbi:MAG: hypothetical protein M1497_04900 [Nitrospirae bacterium]|nr:hypothetical protein [Nitrospirota bacterium]